MSTRAGSDSRQGQTAAVLVRIVEVMDVNEPSETHLLACQLDQPTVVCTTASGKKTELQMFSIKSQCKSKGPLCNT